MTPVVAGRLDLRSLRRLSPDAENPRPMIEADMAVGGEPVTVRLHPEAFESFVRFRSEVVAACGRWVTVEDPFAVTWQDMVSAACAADPGAVPHQAEVER